MGTSATWGPSRIDIRPTTVLVYINDLSQTVNRVAELILFADDSSIVISNSSIEESKSSTNLVMKQLTGFKAITCL